MYHRLLTLLLLVFGLASAAQADPPWTRDDNGHPGQQPASARGPDDDGPKKAKKHGKHERQAARGYFVDDDRRVIQDFYVRNPSQLPPGLAKRGGNLPPGLAKRGGHLPPGLAKGQVIDPSVEVHLVPLPRELEVRLPPPPHEVIRRIIGRDIVLVHEHTHKVLDVLRDALPGH
jgi:hypothetical protein